ncbi:MAG: hypothetical protein FVQ79_07650, partial [Planctomycetes bacterium]|nr:hypothetical protein [Planctomycetota bacterium]
MNLLKDKIVGEILSRLSDRRPEDGPLKVDGTWGSFAPALAAHVSSQLKRPILYVSAHLYDADNAFDDLEVFAPTGVEFFPVWEMRDKYADATDEIGAQRLRISMGLSRSKAADTRQLIIVTSVQALNQPVPKPGTLQDLRLCLEKNQTVEPELVTSWLIDNGFERVDAVDIPGQFAQRGGIIDIFAPVTSSSASSLGKKTAHDTQPLRIE